MNNSSNTFIRWNFKGSKGTANILRIALPCSYSTIKKKILQVINLNPSNGIDIVLYHKNEVLSEHESIPHGILIEIQRTTIDVAISLLQQSNTEYLKKKRKKKLEEQNMSIKINNEDILFQKKENEMGKLQINNVHINNKVEDPSSFFTNRKNDNRNKYISRSSIIRGSGKLGSEDRNGNSTFDELEEKIKIQEVMEKHSLYRSDYRGDGKYYRRDKSNYYAYQNKAKQIIGPGITKDNVGYKRKVSNDKYSTNQYGKPVLNNGNYYGGGGGSYSEHTQNHMSQKYSQYNNKYSKFKNGFKNGINESDTESNAKPAPKPVPPDYICHMCGNKGHSIKDCTMSSYNNNKKIKVPTGIPTNFLTKINPEDIAKYDQIYILKDGSYGILKNVEDVSGSAYLYRSIDDKLNLYLGVNGSISDSHKGGSGTHGSSKKKGETQKLSDLYKCLLCTNLYSSPVTLQCCGETYCKACILKFNRKRKNEQAYYNHANQKIQIIKCPNCSKFINSNELVINTNIKNVIDTIINNNIGKGNNTRGGENVGATTAGNGSNNFFLSRGNNNGHLSNNSSDDTSGNNSTNDNTDSTDRGAPLNKSNNISEKQTPANTESGNAQPSNTETSNKKRFEDGKPITDSLSTTNDTNKRYIYLFPFTDIPINIEEIKREHEFAAAYIAQYKMQKKKKKKKKKY